jgi:Leucine-rich repeat (LRR) protein
MQTLTVLNLEHNRLAKIPEEVGSLRKLRRLEVHHNPLTELPASVGELACLEFLNASHCELQCDDARDRSGLAALGRCHALVEVHLEHNAVGCLPESLAGLRSLKMLFLDHNPLRTVSSAVLTGCVQLHTLSLVSTNVAAEDMQAVVGWSAFEQRRQNKHSKQLAGNVLIGSKGFEDGLDHVMQ